MESGKRPSVLIDVTSHRAAEKIVVFRGVGDNDDILDCLFQLITHPFNDRNSL
ncbi:Uncharacterised protein [Mycobacteroides abscessus subsp. abscessus]|nr:Uncharacterised protein [Mycobacteroides abscessus subsp. abscessus]